MEMHQVRYFLAVCETLNFTRAADICNVAQPSLTRAIKKLEDELGGELFRRERNQTHMTDLGRLMKPHLEQVYGSSEAARVEAKEFRKLEKAPLKLGIMCTIGPARLLGFLTRLHSEIPTIDLSVREAPGKAIVEEVLAGDLDIAVVGMPGYPDRFDVRPLYTERYVVTFPKGHRFEGMTAVPLRELDGEPYLSRSHCEFPDQFAALGVPKPYKLDVKYRSEREDWIQAMILTGLGCAIMPEFLPTLPGIASRVLVEPEISRTVSLVTVAGRRFSPAVQSVVRLIRNQKWQVVDAA
jgi:DNA-binding transcriptional LysR family regulator